MQLRTGWLRPPNAIGGLDHLGTQAPWNEGRGCDEREELLR